MASCSRHIHIVYSYLRNAVDEVTESMQEGLSLNGNGKAADEGGNTVGEADTATVSHPSSFHSPLTVADSDGCVSHRFSA